VNEPDRSDYLTIGKLVNQIAESKPGLISIDITHENSCQLKTDKEFFLYNRHNPKIKGIVCVIDSVNIIEQGIP